MCRAGWLSSRWSASCGFTCSQVGRPWLAWTVCGVRTLSLLLNFCFAPNLNYREISFLRHIRFLGEFVSVAQGAPNPWMLVGHLIFLFLLVFFVLPRSWFGGGAAIDGRPFRWEAP